MPADPPNRGPPQVPHDSTAARLIIHLDRAVGAYYADVIAYSVLTPREGTHAAAIDLIIKPPRGEKARMVDEAFIRASIAAFQFDGELCVVSVEPGHICDMPTIVARVTATDPDFFQPAPVSSPMSGLRAFRALQDFL